MTDEQKFFFDLRGWMLIPAVLDDSECEAVRVHLLSGGGPYDGPAQRLLDHPAVVDILSEILGGGPCPDDRYDFRCEGAFVTIRSQGWTPSGTERPHGGPGVGPQSYKTDGRLIYAGLTRVVWELNPVRRGDGGTLFLSGSHRSSFPYPPSVLAPDNPHLEDYACPPGSVLIFTESLLHAATVWKNPEVQRVAIFYAYNHYSAQYHRLNLAHEKVLAMPEKRRTLFRGVYIHDFTVRPHEEGSNRYYSESNRAL